MKCINILEMETYCDLATEEKKYFLKKYFNIRHI